MSSSEIDLYSKRVKQSSKFNEVESNDDKNVITSPKILVTKTTPKRKLSSKSLTPKVDKKKCVQPKIPYSSDENSDLLALPPLKTRRPTKESPGQKRAMTSQQWRRKSKSSKRQGRRRKKWLGEMSFKLKLSDEEPEIIAENTEKIVSNVNFEHKIIVWWKSTEEIKAFQIRKYQKLQPIFDFYAKRDGILINSFRFLSNHKIIYPTDTPYTLKFNRVHVIEAGCFDSNIEFGSREPHNSSMMQFKIQMCFRKNPLLVFIKKTEPFSVLMAKCTEELECDINKLRFVFDGELLNPKDTPETLNLDGGECIDIFVT